MTTLTHIAIAIAAWFVTTAAPAAPHVYKLNTEMEVS